VGQNSTNFGLIFARKTLISIDPPPREDYDEDDLIGAMEFNKRNKVNPYGA